MDRLYQLKKHGKFKSKNKALHRKDKAYATIIKQHKRGEINLETYINKVVKLNREKDLPKGRRALAMFLESDSDSEGWVITEVSSIQLCHHWINLMPARYNKIHYDFRSPSKDLQAHEKNRLMMCVMKSQMSILLGINYCMPTQNPHY